ncbi:GNAT family N-acetyltransferase [Streptomyces spongiicola]|uniref:GNAT family N-acetyltransferase n=1 Tax=Streptomyces spongiicola TaxID=1690221 RepID=A0ABN5L0M6_9ACTN|nr:GNAT family N-acetyltransferase [Streptomyces spongiicola]
MLACVSAREPTALTLTQFARPAELSGALRRELAECWAAVVNAGGAVIPADCPPPPLVPADVAAAVDHVAERLAPEHCRLLVAALEGSVEDSVAGSEAGSEAGSVAGCEAGSVAGWLVVRREGHPLEAHCGVLNHVQTRVHLRRRGIGAALMGEARRVAREEMGLERLKLSVRAGLGLEEFYRRAGWTEVGRWPGALRLAPGDDRDEILMSLAL